MSDCIVMANGSHSSKQKGFGRGRRRASSQRGFTLLEVVIALAVVALALSAIIQTSGGFIANQTYLRDRTMAHWVARNVLTEWQILKGWPDVGEHSGSADFADQEWDWTVQVKQTKVEEMRRLNVEVRHPQIEGDVLAVLDGFVKKSQE